MVDRDFNKIKYKIKNNIKNNLNYNNHYHIDIHSDIQIHTKSKYTYILIVIVTYNNLNYNTKCLSPT